MRYLGNEFRFFFGPFCLFPKNHAVCSRSLKLPAFSSFVIDCCREIPRAKGARHPRMKSRLIFWPAGDLNKANGSEKNSDVPALRSLRCFLRAQRNLVILLIAIFVIGAGEELWMRFVPKYLQAVGATVFVIGLYDALRTLLGAIYAYPGGVLADRWGHRHAFIIFNVVSIIGYALVLLIPNWGGSHSRNVSLPVMDLFFPAGNVFARRRCTRSTPPLHGHRRSIGHQTIADHDCADFRRDVDRSTSESSPACASGLSSPFFFPP